MKIAYDTTAHRVTGDITHNCLANSLCRAATTQKDTTTGKSKRIGATTEKPNTLCRRCFSAIRVAVEDLPQDYADLSEEIGERQRAEGEKVHFTSDPASPLDLGKDELMGEIRRGLADAARRVTTITGAHPANNNVWGYSQLLSNNLHALINSPAEPEEEWCGNGESVQTRNAETGRIEYRPNTRITMRNGIEAGLRLVDLHSRAQSKLNATTNGLRKLPIGMPGCNECGEILYTDGTRVVCRACARDWTEHTAGLYQKEREMIEELKAQLAAVTAQRDTAWDQLDRVQVLADAIYLPDYDQVTAHQFGELLADIIKDHPSPETRTATTEPAAKQEAKA